MGIAGDWYDIQRINTLRLTFNVDIVVYHWINRLSHIDGIIELLSDIIIYRIKHHQWITGNRDPE